MRELSDISIGLRDRFKGIFSFDYSKDYREKIIKPLDEYIRTAREKLMDKTIYELEKKIYKTKRYQDLKEHITYLEKQISPLMERDPDSFYFHWGSARRKTLEKLLRAAVIRDLEFRVSMASSDRFLEDLAKEVGYLQAQSEYVKEYGKVLNDLQTKIEEKYSLLGKASLYLKKLFKRGRRASQIRTASQMLNQLNKEISDLKKEL